MIRLLFIYILLFIAIQIGYSQNLVPNNDFEEYSTCPFTSAQISFVNDWQNAGASVDYYNSCDNTNVASVPTNVRGFQYASIGNGYIGMAVFALDEVMDTSNYYYREPAIVQLTSPLVVGQKYFVSFKAVLSLNDFEACCATNKLGALFSTVQYSLSQPAPINNFAHVYSNTIITDTINWTTVSGSFIADSAYTFMSIGNFFDTLNTDVVDFHNDYPISTAAYYYIDDVKVSTDSAYVIGIPVISNNSHIRIYPNPTSGLLYIDGFLEDHYDIELYDLSGRLIYQTKNQRLESLNFALCESGMYIIILNNEHYHFSKYLIINK